MRSARSPTAWLLWRVRSPAHWPMVAVARWQDGRDHADRSYVGADAVGAALCRLARRRLTRPRGHGLPPQAAAAEAEGGRDRGAGRCAVGYSDHTARACVTTGRYAATEPGQFNPLDGDGSGPDRSGQYPEERCWRVREQELERSGRCCPVRSHQSHRSGQRARSSNRAWRSLPW